MPSTTDAPSERVHSASKTNQASPRELADNHLNSEIPTGKRSRPPSGVQETAVDASHQSVITALGSILLPGVPVADDKESVTFPERPPSATADTTPARNNSRPPSAAVKINETVAVPSGSRQSSAKPKEDQIAGHGYIITSTGSRPSSSKPNTDSVTHAHSRPASANQTNSDQPSAPPHSRPPSAAHGSNNSRPPSANRKDSDEPTAPPHSRPPSAAHGSNNSRPPSAAHGSNNSRPPSANRKDSDHPAAPPHFRPSSAAHGSNNSRPPSAKDKHDEETTDNSTLASTTDAQNHSNTTQPIIGPPPSVAKPEPPKGVNPTAASTPQKLTKDNKAPAGSDTSAKGRAVQRHGGPATKKS